MIIQATFTRTALIGGLTAAALAVGLSLPAQAETVSMEYDGLTLNANHVVPPEADAIGPTVLMVHGTLAHNKMETIAAIQDALAQQNINSLAINLGLGVDNRTGSYDCAAEHRHKHTDAIAEIGAWVDWLKGEGVQAITLLGHSRGGNQVAWYASQADDSAIKGAVLVAPALWDPEAFAASYEESTGTALSDVLSEAEGMDPEALMTLDRFLYCDDAKVAAGTVLDYYGDDARRNTPTLLADIEVPTVVVIGTADDVVPGLLGEMEGVEGDNVTLSVVHGATHYFRDLYVDDIVAAVETAMGR